MNNSVRSKLWREKNPALLQEYKQSHRGKYGQLKRAAKRANRDFDISLEEYTNIVNSNLCFYCGESLPLVGYGLDRMDNTKGYTKNNVVPCCGIKNGSRHNSCNFKKGHLEAAGLKYPRTVEILKEMLNNERIN